MKRQSGTILPALLIICGAFIIVIYGLLFILTLQFDFSNRQTASEHALNVAEAGINYYRWHLAHDPSDFADGTGTPGQTYIHEYYDPQGTKIGSYSLEIEEPENGSSIVTIKSTGWLDQYPNIKRTITAQYGKESLGKYSFLTHASSWYGTNVKLYGPVHSNNGIRMDGINFSTVSSAKDEYKCGSETGCFPSEWKPGIWGTGGDQGLWIYPASTIDFGSISFDFARMKEDAQNSGLYLDKSNSSGYHLVFNIDGTFNVYKVTSTDWIDGYSVPGAGLGQEGQGGCRKRYQIIKSQTLVGTYQVSERPIIFIEDHIWVEGTVKGRTTVVAAQFPINSKYSNAYITNNLVYSTKDGSDILGLVAQNDIYISRDVPNNFEINGILIAQQGKIMRHGYLQSCGGSVGAVKDKLTIYGSIISYEKSYWNYGTAPESGFINREINYDPHVLYNPPPYFPFYGDYEFISWKED